MKRLGQVSAVMAVVAAVLLGFGCGGVTRAVAPVSEQHHHSPGAPGHEHAILIHASCCVSIPGPVGSVAATTVRIQPVAWLAPVEVIPSGQRVSPDPRPPKSIL